MNLKMLIKKIINPETISYLFFGVLTTVVSLVSYWFIVYSMVDNAQPNGMQIQIATVGSWILAVAFAYITNKLFVFKSKSFEKKILLKEAISFVGARLLSLGYEMLWMFIMADLLKIDDFICKFIAQFVIVALNYIFSKLFIFKKK